MNQASQLDLTAVETAVAEKKPRALARRERADAALPVSETAAVIQMIERAARDPSVDIDKMERLILMRRQMQADAAKSAYAAALAKMQAALPVIEEKGRIIVRDKSPQKNIIQSTSYALWEDINETIRPILAEHGFALSFRVGLAGDGRITVTGILSHEAGHQEETMMTLPHDSTGSKNAVQAVGSSTSYGKRYTACALLNITSRGEDDDGKAAGIESTISDDQVADLQGLIDEVAADKDRFLRLLFGIPDFEGKTLYDIPASKFSAAVSALEAKRAR
jgi:ERF superfamily